MLISDSHQFSHLRKAIRCGRKNAPFVQKHPICLVLWNMFYFSLFFPSYWECHHPNWRFAIFFRGVGLFSTRKTCDCGMAWLKHGATGNLQNPMEIPWKSHGNLEIPWTSGNPNICRAKAYHAMPSRPLSAPIRGELSHIKQCVVVKLSTTCSIAVLFFGVSLVFDMPRVFQCFSLLIPARSASSPTRAFFSSGPGTCYTSTCADYTIIILG